MHTPSFDLKNCPGDDNGLVSVILAVQEAEGSVAQSLEALRRTDLPRSRWELIVVADGIGAAAVADVAALYADTVVRLPGPSRGLMYARNRGVDIARGDIIVFFDVATCVRPDTVRRLAETVCAKPGWAGVFGTYDIAAASSGFVARYFTLLWGYAHQRAATAGESITAPCVAFDRRALEAAGLYDEWRASTPEVGNAEIRYRLRRLGFRVCLRPDITVARATTSSWRELSTVGLATPNVAWLSRETRDSRRQEPPWQPAPMATGVVLWAGLITSGVALLLQQFPGYEWLPLAITTVATVGANLALYRFFGRRAGIGFALAAVPFHLVHSLVCAPRWCWDQLVYHLVGEPRPDPTMQAFAELGMRAWPPVPARRAEVPGALLTHDTAHLGRHQPPFRKIITGTVRSMILTSSKTLFRARYPRS